jgi:hypothetical protein
LEREAHGGFRNRTKRNRREGAAGVLLEILAPEATLLAPTGHSDRQVVTGGEIEVRLRPVGAVLILIQTQRPKRPADLGELGHDIRPAARLSGPIEQRLRPADNFHAPGGERFEEARSRAHQSVAFAGTSADAAHLGDADVAAIAGQRPRRCSVRPRRRDAQPGELRQRVADVGEPEISHQRLMVDIRGHRHFCERGIRTRDRVWLGRFVAVALVGHE